MGEAGGSGTAGGLHERGPINEDLGDALWHRGNIGEALPGVATPLNADFWRSSAEAALLETFLRFGAITRAERGAPDGTGSPFSGRICRFFYGRFAADFDIIGDLYGRLPGVDPSAIEEQMIGHARDRARPRVARRRQALAAAKMAWAALAAPGAMRRHARSTRRWWREQLDRLDGADAPTALGVFDGARDRMRHDLTLQIVVGSLQPGFVEKARQLASSAGIDDATIEALLSGIGGIAEARMMRALWDVAHGDLPLQEFLERYGYYAPDEGELSTRSWREDPAGLDSVLHAYATMPEQDGPVARLHARRDAHARARDRARSSLRGTARPRFGILLRLARRYTELREEGKVLLLECLDVARAAARVLGSHLTQMCVIDEPDDIFFLTRDEIADVLESSTRAQAMIAARRTRHDRYRELVLPLSFTGPDLRRAVDEQIRERETTGAACPQPLDVVEGLGVSPGQATGVARVIVDPLDCADFAPGEILVCPTTDPGWAPLLSLAGGVVLDMGSMLSHGAIVARELGVPCVANTADGTRRITNGALVRVDGDAGTVEMLATPEPAPDAVAS